MKHFYVDMESRTTIGNRRVFSGISSPRRGLILLITRRPEFISYFSYPVSVSTSISQRRFGKLTFSQLEILKWLLGFEHFLIQEPGVFVYRLRGFDLSAKSRLECGRLDLRWRPASNLSIFLSVKGEVDQQPHSPSVSAQNFTGPIASQPYCFRARIHCFCCLFFC